MSQKGIEPYCKYMITLSFWRTKIEIIVIHFTANRNVLFYVRHRLFQSFINTRPGFHQIKVSGKEEENTIKWKEREIAENSNIVAVYLFSSVFFQNLNCLCLFFPRQPIDPQPSRSSPQHVTNRPTLNTLFYYLPRIFLHPEMFLSMFLGCPSRSSI